MTVWPLRNITIRGSHYLWPLGAWPPPHSLNTPLFLRVMTSVNDVALCAVLLQNPFLLIAVSLTQLRHR